MKYTNDIVTKIVEMYEKGTTPKEIAAELEQQESERTGTLTLVPERSVIAKLSSLGVYRRKEYLNKRGEAPIKKEEYIERIADLLDINVDLMESLEKVTKAALVLLENRIRDNLEYTKSLESK